jgi:hypothetical protein
MSERGVNVAIPDAVRQIVGARLEQRLRVGQIVHVRGDSQPARVRLLDGRAVDLGPHLLRGAQVVVDADLDEVRISIGVEVHRRTRGLGIGRNDDRPRHVDARAGQVARAVAVAHAEPRVPVIAEAHDRRDAVAGVQAELPRHILLGVELGRARQSYGAPNVPVRVDDAGHDCAPTRIDVLGTDWHRHLRGGSDGLDPPVLHHEHAVRDRRRARPSRIVALTNALTPGSGGRRLRRGAIYT